MDGPAVRDGIVDASRFAEDDPYRAATHNKGIMNGVDAVVIATGNDWRGVEAGAHAFAAIDGRYRPLATWRADPDGGADADLGRTARDADGDRNRRRHAARARGRASRPAPAGRHRREDAGDDRRQRRPRLQPRRPPRAGDRRHPRAGTCPCTTDPTPSPTPTPTTPTAPTTASRAARAPLAFGLRGPRAVWHPFLAQTLTSRFVTSSARSTRTPECGG